MPLELHDLNWDLGFGRIQTALNPWASPSWVKVAADAAETLQREPATPDIDPRRSAGEYVPSVGETCFIRPDGEIACVVTGSIWEVERRSKGWREVPADSPYERPAEAAEPARLPYEEIPTDVETSVFEPAAPSARSGSVMAQLPGWDSNILDWGQAAIDLYQDWRGPAQPQFLTGAPAMNQLPPPGYSVGATGPAKPCRRRRRRPLLTPTDLNTLAALKTITGNNDALKFAVMKAVRR